MQNSCDLEAKSRLKRAPDKRSTITGPRLAHGKRAEELREELSLLKKKTSSLEDQIQAFEPSRIEQQKLSGELHARACKAEAALQKEQELRVESERKLKEYIDAQKKMTAQFA